jgi:GH24 family phage-related lysozyme (muramidase)/uncharacterized protein (DUF2345 family)
MPKEIRSSAQQSLKELGFTGSGPFEAVVVSHLDPGYMGSLKVDLLRKNQAGSFKERVGTTIEVSYLSPFYGVTNKDHSTANDGYENTQKSYGMWFVPPDTGTRVLVTFAEGDISRGFWIGCIQDQYMNFMLPDGRASTEITTDGTPGELKGKKLPTGEYNKRLSKANKDPTMYAKPYNSDFSESLVKQGLIDDEHRGTTTTSARREVPSAVFGISTPGPIDKRSGAIKGEYGEFGSKANVFVNRLGGSSFVMDDGDDKFIRKTPASEGPPDYANVEKGDYAGDRTIPQNEVFRLRTRTGHQILMHNSEDLIYIGNAKGTSWIELSSNGKIDIYAHDSISVHTDQDLNFTADRDVNIEAGRNIHMRARGREEGGNIQMESKHDTHLLVENDMKVDIKKFQDITVGKDRNLTVEGDSHHDVTGTIFVLADKDINYKAKLQYNLETLEGNINVLSGANININSPKGKMDILASAVIAIDGSLVHINSGIAGPAAPAVDAVVADTFEPLLTFDNSQIVPSDMSKVTVKSIVKRMPSHEPWLQHENLMPADFKPEKTDVLIEEPIVDSEYIRTTDTFRKNRTSSELGPELRQQQPGRSVPASTRTNVDSRGLPRKPVMTPVPTDLTDFIKKKEGFRSKAYWDNNQYSIGYGTKAKSRNEVITEEEAEARLIADVAGRREFVKSYSEENNYNWNDSQVDSLSSFSYNLGNGSIDQVTAGGTRTNAQIASKMKLYDTADGNRLAGLTQRRDEESRWFSQT